MIHIPPWLLVVIVLNIAIIVIVLNPNISQGIFAFENNVNNQPISNGSKTPSTQTSPQTTNQAIQANQTFNDNVYKLNCINSISNYVKNIENITNFTNIETKFFNKTEDSINYIRNWSSNTFELIGTGIDIYSLNKTNRSVVSVNNFKRNDEKKFILPIVCDEKGIIGNYSACILTNISNMTFYCHSLTETLTECEVEKMTYDFWQDISYWITPKPGPLNESQVFNFTIVSSRNRLEYASLWVWYKRPPSIDKNLFNQSKTTMKGDKITITVKLNLTGKIYGGLSLEAYFKKRCYKYDLLSQYVYYGG